MARRSVLGNTTQGEDQESSPIISELFYVRH